MRFEYSGFTLIYSCPEGEKAADIFRSALSERCDVPFGTGADVKFICDGREDRDSFDISVSDSEVIFTASGIRGLIFAIGRFLRKCVYEAGKIILIRDISGSFSPDRKIRGHQLGYRTTPNSYDAWTLEEYRKYYIDLMFFACNTVEHIPYENGRSNRNALMKYDEEDFLEETAKDCQELDLDVSLWFPNCEKVMTDDAIRRRDELFSRVGRINAVFPPGGDPGDLPAEEFVRRSRIYSVILKEHHPDAEMWPSAQAPHSIAGWGDSFIEAMNDLPDEIDGVITGPNHAFDMDTLRRKLPVKYPIRFYPDITHNVRCEYPVHNDRDDWHFAWASTLSRECVNPRPSEYSRLHSLTERYTVGSVSYSEGTTDDVNKCIWSDLDFNPSVSLRETLGDYARLFFPGVPAGKITDLIEGLEIDWDCDPADNPCVDRVFELSEALCSDYPSLNKNWRFLQLQFRAMADKIVRMRRLFELELIDEARAEAENGRFSSARSILLTDYPDEYKALRRRLEAVGKLLFDLIGLQLDVQRYCANGWERGAVLSTIDRPVTDRAFLLSVSERVIDKPEKEAAQYLTKAFSRNKTEKNEFYYSVALNGLAGCNCRQQGEVYMDFQGDRPEANDGTLPTALFCFYDNYTFRLRTGGFEDCDHKLKITFPNVHAPEAAHFTIKANGITVYDGPFDGGEKDEEYDREMLTPRYVSGTFTLPKEVFVNGCLELELGEETTGVMLAELRITRK